LPPAEREVVARALAREPRARWPNCVTFAAELALAVRRGQEVPTRRLPPPGAFALLAPAWLTLEPGPLGLSVMVQVQRGTWAGPRGGVGHGQGGSDAPRPPRGRGRAHRPWHQGCRSGNPGAVDRPAGAGPGEDPHRRCGPGGPGEAPPARNAVPPRLHQGRRR